MQNEESVPNYELDFLGLLEESKRELERDEKDEQNEPSEPDSSQELENVIAAEKAVYTVKKTTYEWKKLKNSVRSKVKEHLMCTTYLLKLSTSSWPNFSKMSVNKMVASKSQIAFPVSNEAYSVA